jgi:D-serine deaminase-like pyridoxal phosphate-dependent protein
LKGGTPWDSPKTTELAETIAKSSAVKLKGLYSHCGATYDSTSAEEIKEKSNMFAERIASVANTQVLNLDPFRPTYYIA